jgi:pSer/pThr/pTyr-binding forkhead associated (FHA) protein
MIVEMLISTWLRDIMEVEVSTDKDIDNDTDIGEIVEGAGDSFEISKIIVHHFNQRNEVDSTREIEFVNSLKIGRSNVSPNPSENPKDGLFDSKVMSRSHAVISFKTGKFFIQDLNSSNGTFINEFNMEPMKEEAIYSEDILQFGTRVGLHEPVKVKVELFCPNENKYEERGTNCENLGSISEKDIMELNKTLEEAGTSVAAIKKKLTALEDIIDDFKDLHDRNKIEKEFLEKIKNIENTLESLKALETSKSRNREEINLSIRNILVEVIQELIVDQSLDDGKQKTFLQLMINKLRKSCFEEDLVDEYNITITKSTASTLRPSRSPERVFSPIVFYQDDEIEGMEPREISPEDVQIRSEHTFLDLPKGILKAPNSPRTSVKLIRINVIPEVREIENCLQDNGCVEVASFVNQLEEDSPESEEEKPKVTNNVPRRRSWMKVREKFIDSEF